MKIICSVCGRDINALGQDNMSYSLEYNLCEDCYLKNKISSYITLEEYAALKKFIRRVN